MVCSTLIIPHRYFSIWALKIARNIFELRNVIRMFFALSVNVLAASIIPGEIY